MTLAILALVLGILVLVWSADRFVVGAAATAHHLGMKPLLVGMLVVGFGTSAPEMLVSALAAIDGRPGIALGNAFGSNIANIGLILGVTALVSPIFVQSKLIRSELPVLLVITLAVSALIVTFAGVPLLVALVLLLGFAAFIFWSLMQAKSKKDPVVAEVMEGNIPPLSMGKGLFWLIVGLVLLLLSSRSLIYGAVEIARTLGMSEVMIGLTIVAVGTSLPELASSISAARKGEHDIALGNVIGSNIFNILAVIGIAGSVAPFSMPREVLLRDSSVMFALTIVLYWLCRNRTDERGGAITRFEGSILLLGYLGYTGYLIYEMLR